MRRVLLCIPLLVGCVGEPDDDDSAAVDLPGAPATLTAGAPVTCADPAPAGPLPFTDVTESSGVAYVAATPQWTLDPVVHPSAELEAHGGFAVADLDGDTHLDLLFTDAIAGPKLFLGDGAFGFTEVDAQARGLPDAGPFAHGASAVDIDADGDLDLFLLYMGHNRMLRNDGAGNFEDITVELGLAGRDEDRSLSASWADFDRDGDLDLYVANHGEGSYGPGDTYEPDPDHLYVREPNGRFRDRIDWIVTPDQHGYAFLAGWFDADDDGWLDLYVVNDLAVDDAQVIGNLFFHNEGAADGTGAWRMPHAPDTQLDFRMAGMGLAIGDMDGDGDQDLHISNAGATTLARNDGGVFTDVSLAVAGFSDGTAGDISWATTWLDHDNDGDLELFAGYGHMPTKVGDRAPNQAVNNEIQPDALWSTDDGGGAFTDIGADVGIANPERTRAAVVADIDRDGFPDLVTWALFSGPSVYRGGCNDNRWLRVALSDSTAGNPSAIGARVEAWADGALVAMDDVAVGSDEVMSSGPAEVLLGLGDHDEVTVVVRWPDGEVTANPGVGTRRGIELAR